MANTVPASWPAPDPFDYSSGEAIRSADVQPLANALNWLQAYGLAGPVIQQGWDPIIVNRTNAALAMVAQWRIPPLAGRTSVQCTARALSTPAGIGTVEFRSITAGGAVAVNPNAAAAAYYTAGALLPVNTAAGYETIELWIAGDGANTVGVDNVCVEYLALASPLAAGSVGSFVAFDAAELGNDRPFSSRVGLQMIDDLTALNTRLKVDYQWSGVDEAQVVNPGAAATFMPAWLHRAWSVPWQGTRAEGLNLTIHVEARNSSGVDPQFVVFYVGGLGAGVDARRVAIEVPAAAGARAWYTLTTAQLSPAHEVYSLPEGMDMVQLGLQPIDANAPHPQNTNHFTSAEVYTVSIWSQ